jgi:hypothetical protein
MSRINPPPAIPDVDPSTKAAFQQEILEKVTCITTMAILQLYALLGTTLACSAMPTQGHNQAALPPSTRAGAAKAEHQGQAV